MILLLILQRRINYAIEPVIDDRICKHWAIAGFMKGSVSLWDLQVAQWPNVGYCSIPSLYAITCCGNEFYEYPSAVGYSENMLCIGEECPRPPDDPEDEPIIIDWLNYTEHVHNPVCCYRSDTCCQPRTDFGKDVLTLGRKMDIQGNSSIIIRNHSRVVYRPVSPENNPHLGLFNQTNTIQDQSKLSPHNIAAIFFIGIFIIVALIIVVVWMCISHSKKERKCTAE
jgi:hypothetical protein